MSSSKRLRRPSPDFDPGQRRQPFDRRRASAKASRQPRSSRRRRDAHARRPSCPAPRAASRAAPRAVTSAVVRQEQLAAEHCSEEAPEIARPRQAAVDREEAIVPGAQRVEHLGDAEGHAFQHRLDQLLAAGRGVEADPEAGRASVPVRAGEPAQRRDEEDAARRRAARPSSASSCAEVGEQAEPQQPFDRRRRRIDAAVGGMDAPCVARATRARRRRPGSAHGPRSPRGRRRRCRRSPWRRRAARSRGRRAPRSDRRARPRAAGRPGARRSVASHSTISGRASSGTPKISQSTGSQAQRSRFISEVRAAVVTSVDVAAGQALEEPGVAGAEPQPARREQLPRLGHLVEDPAQLRRREIGVERQAGALGHLGLHALGAERLDPGGGALVLPDDGVAERRAGRRGPRRRRSRPGWRAPPPRRRPRGRGRGGRRRRAAARPRRAPPGPAPGRICRWRRAPSRRWLPSSSTRERLGRGRALVDRDDAHGQPSSKPAVRTPTSARSGRSRVSRNAPLGKRAEPRRAPEHPAVGGQGQPARRGSRHAHAHLQRAGRRAGHGDRRRA